MLLCSNTSFIPFSKSITLEITKWCTTFSGRIGLDTQSVTTFIRRRSIYLSAHSGSHPVQVRFWTPFQNASIPAEEEERLRFGNAETVLAQTVPCPETGSPIVRKRPGSQSETKRTGPGPFRHRENLSRRLKTADRTRRRASTLTDPVRLLCISVCYRISSRSPAPAS